MLKLCSEITIEGEKVWQFTAVADCIIVEDVSTLTDTCEIQLSKKIKWQEAITTSGKPPVKKGDKITVKLGYDGNLQTRFSGFIRSALGLQPPANFLPLSYDKYSTRVPTAVREPRQVPLSCFRVLTYGI